MIRGLHVHDSPRGPSPTLPRLWSDDRYEDESTKKVPDYLIALARVCADDLAIESHTQPMFVEPGDHPPSGIVPAAHVTIEERESTLPREVIPPPPRRPHPKSFAFAATLDAFAFSDPPFLALAENDAPSPRRRPRRRLLRAEITQSIAAAVLALTAVLMLFALGTKPRLIVEPSARTAITAHARADRDDPSGSARAHAAPRATTARIEWRPAPPPPARALPTPAPATKAPGRIIRNAPF